MTPSQDFQGAVYLDWWGLVRRPPVHVEMQLSRAELLLVGLLTGAFMNLLLAMAIYLIEANPVASLFSPRAGLWLPLAVLVVPVAVARVVPLDSVKDRTVGQWLLAARAQGRLRKGDPFLRPMLVAGVLGCAYRFVMAILDSGQLITAGEFGWILPALLSVGAAGVASGVLGEIPEMPFVPRGNRAAFPAWLDEELDRLRDASEPVPESGSAFVYPFPAPEEAQIQVGVAVPEELIAELRGINDRFGGQFYQDEDFGGTREMINGEGPVVEGRGVPEMKRLIAQVASVVPGNEWTRWDLANRLLLFVQRNITYAFDHSTTEALVGRVLDDYGRFPLESLVDGEGDCEDTSLLAAAMLVGAGYRCALVIVRAKPSLFTEPGRHAMVAVLLDETLFPWLELERLEVGSCFVHEGRRYAIGETTSKSPSPEAFGLVSTAWMDQWEIERVIELEPST